MLYFATLNPCAELAPGHARATPTSSAKAWIDGLFIRLLSGGQGGYRPPNSTRACNVVFIPETIACKPAVRYGQVEFAPYPSMRISCDSRTGKSLRSFCPAQLRRRPQHNRRLHKRRKGS